MRAALILVFAFMLTSCSLDRPQTDGVFGGSDDRQGQTYFIDGIPAEEFYHRLSYVKEGENRHRYLTTDGWIYTGGESAGDLYFKLWLFLHGDQSYQLVYEEAIAAWYTNGEFKITRPIFKRTYTGKYVVKGVELQLPRIARATGAFSNNRASINLEMLRNLHMDSFAGFSPSLNLVSAEISPQELMKDYIDQGLYKWLDGKWEVKDKPQKFRFSQSDRRLVIDRFEGVVNSAGIPMTCHFRVTSGSVAANVRIEETGTRHQIEYMPAKFELLSHDSNSSGCAEYIRQENARLATRTWPEYLFLIQMSDKKVATQEGHVYQKD